MTRGLRVMLLLIAALAAVSWWSARESAAPVDARVSSGASPGAERNQSRYPAFLPSEAISTLQAIERGGPFPYDRDGVVFQNREHRLPEQPRGYYREYTVATPGSRDRGARRIITGGDPPEAWYYTDDHYRSFRQVEPR